MRARQAVQICINVTKHMIDLADSLQSLSDTELAAKMIAEGQRLRALGSDERDKLREVVRSAQEARDLIRVFKYNS